MCSSEAAKMTVSGPSSQRMYSPEAAKRMFTAPLSRKLCGPEASKMIVSALSSQNMYSVEATKGMASAPAPQNIFSPEAAKSMSSAPSSYKKYSPETAKAVPQQNVGGEEGFSATRNSWSTNSVQFGNTGGAQPKYVQDTVTIAQQGQTRQLSAPEKPPPSRFDTRRQSVGRSVKKNKAKGKNSRWGNHNHQICMCAVCRQLRGESKSSWYNHDQSKCACAVCRQSRGESRQREAKNSFRAILDKKYVPTAAKRGSWMEADKPKVECVECVACGTQRPLYGGQLQSPLFPNLPVGRSSNTNVKSSLTSLPESSTPTAMTLPWQHQLRNWTEPEAGSSTLTIPSVLSPFLAPTPNAFDLHYDRLKNEQRLGFFCSAENLKAGQQDSGTNLLSKSSFAGWSKLNPSYSRNSAANNSGAWDCSNLRQSWDSPTTTSYERSTSGFPWQKNTGDMGQEVAGTSTGLHDAGLLQLETGKTSPGLHNTHDTASLQLETGKLNPPFTQAWEMKEDTVSAITNVAEGSGLCTPNPFSVLCEADLDAADSPSGTHQGLFHHPGQSASFLGAYPSSVVDVHPDIAAPSKTVPEIDGKAPDVPWSFPNFQPCAPRSSTISQFPFGLEVQQAQVEHEISQPAFDLNETIQSQSLSFHYDQSTTGSSSPPFETVYPTNVLHEEDNGPQVMDIDSGDIVDSSSVILQGGEEKLISHNEGAVGGQVKPQQLLKSGSDKRVKPTKGARQHFSKNSVNLGETHHVKQPKGTKRKRVSKFLAHPSPKWRQLIQNKDNYVIVTRKICIRTRVPQNCPQSLVSNLSDPKLPMINDVEKGKGNTRSVIDPGKENYVECSSTFKEPIKTFSLLNTDPTSIRESPHVTAAPGGLISMQHVSTEQDSDQLCDGLLDTDCRQGFALSSSKTYLVTIPDIDIEENQRAQKIRHLNCSRTMPEFQEIQHTAPEDPHSSDHSHEKSEAAQLEDVISASDSTSPKCTQDMPLICSSNKAIKAKRLEICVQLQLTDPLIQDVLAKFGHGPQCRKRARTEMGTCHKRTRESEQDYIRCLSLKSEDMCLFQPLKKRLRGQSHHGAFLSKSFCCTALVSLSRINPGKAPHLMCKNARLPGAVKIFYLDDIQSSRTSPTPEIQLTRLARITVCQSPINHIVYSTSCGLLELMAALDNLPPKFSFDPLHCMPLGYSAPFAGPFQVLNCGKSPVPMTWLKMLSNLSICHLSNISKVEGRHFANSQLEITSDCIIVHKVARIDLETHGRFWQSPYTTNFFRLLRHDELTLYMEDQITFNQLERMTRRILSRLCWTRRKCDVNDSAIPVPKTITGSLEGSKSQQESLTHNTGFIKLRTLFFPYCVDKPLNCCQYWTRSGLLSRNNLPRLISACRQPEDYFSGEEQMAKLKLGVPHCLRGEKQECGAKRQPKMRNAGTGMTSDESVPLLPRSILECDGAERYITSSEEEQLAKSQWKLVLPHCSSPEQEEFSSDRELADHNLGDRMTSKEDSPLPLDTRQASILHSIQLQAVLPDQSLMEHGYLQPLSAFHRDLITTSPQQNPTSPSFRELLKSVLTVESSGLDSPQLMSNCRSRTDSNTASHHVHPSGSFPSIPDLDVWEGHSVLRRDNQASAPLSCSTTSFRKPVSSRRRGCPKGGWPQRNKSGIGKNVPVLRKDLVIHHNTISKRGTDIEADFEVLQPTAVKLSNKHNSDYKKKLETFLEIPFSLRELQDLEEQASLRKPQLRLRETRQRVLHVATKRDGMSYLDHHPDLARKLADARAPEERLRLLRGFVFWLQHACTSGSFKPWASDFEEAEESDDCVEIFPEDGVTSYIRKSTWEGTAKQTTGASQKFPKKVGEESERHMTLRSRGRGGVKSASKCAMKARVKRE